MIETSEMSKTGGTNVDSVRSLAAVADNVHTHLALGGLDSGVGVSRRDSVALGEKDEVVDQGFHVLLHGGSGGRGDLVVFHTDGAGRHLVQALVDDAKGLAELLHSAEIAIIAITIDADRDVKFNLVVCVVRSALSDVPRDTGATQHNTSEREIESFLGGHNADTLETVDPDAVIRQHLLGLVDAVSELGRPLVDVVQQANRDVLMHSTRSDVGSMETSSRNALIEFLDRACQFSLRRASPQGKVERTGESHPADTLGLSRINFTYHKLLSLLESPQKRRESANVHGVRQNGHEVVEDTGELAKQGTNVLGTLGNLDVEQLLDGQGEALFIGHHGDVVEPVEVRQGLNVGLVLAELLGTTVQQANVGIGADDFLAVELEDQTQHAVGGGMLWPEVHRVVSHLAVFDRVVARFLARGFLWSLNAIRVGRDREVAVHGD